MTSDIATQPEAGLPIVKWVGGKTRLLPKIIAHYGGQRTIIEPFMGGGALSFHLSAKNPELRVVGNDHLEPLIEIYNAVRNAPDEFINDVETYALPYLACDGKDARRAFYYDVRQKYMTRELDGPAPLFFMLRCAYSGMYRTGKTHPGRFNTSHGFGQEKAGFYMPERLRAASRTMSNWELSSGDFEKALDKVTGDSFVLLDPPYRETYTGYTGAGFSEEDQLRVVDFFKRADRRGARVVYTNRFTGDDFYEQHLGNFCIDAVPIKYQVNSNCVDVGRPETHEVIISNGPAI